MTSTVVALGTAGSLCTACAPDPPVRVGANLWPGYEPFFLAQSLGYYGEHPIELTEFPSAGDVVRAYRAGLIDLAALTADEALALAETGTGDSIILVCDTSLGADAILARPEFASMSDLKGRRVGYEQSAVGAYMLARALDRSSMTVTDIVSVPVPLEEHERAFASRTVDAIVTFEPRRTRLITAGARVVFDSSQIPGEVTDVLVARTAVLESHQFAVQALVDGWFRALEYLRTRPDAAAARLAARQQLEPSEFLASLSGLDQPDRRANQRLLRPGAAGLLPALRRLAMVMYRYKLLSREVEPGNMLDDRFVRTGRS